MQDVHSHWWCCSPPVIIKIDAIDFFSMKKINIYCVFLFATIENYANFSRLLCDHMTDRHTNIIWPQ